MTRRPSPLEQMRRLADDGLEAWQIAAALGVREQAVLVALGDPAPAGGAVRAVEQASSVVPAEPSIPVEKPATPPAEPGPRYGTVESAAAGGTAVHTLNGRIAALGTTVAQIRTWAKAEGLPVPERGMIPAALVDRWAAAHAAPLHDLDERPDPVEAARQARDAAADEVLDAFREHAAAVDAEVDAITPEQVEQRLAEVLDFTPPVARKPNVTDPYGHDNHEDCGPCDSLFGECCVHCPGWPGHRREPVLNFEEKQCADAADASPTTAPAAATPSASTAAAPAATTTAMSPVVSTADPRSATDGQPATTPPNPAAAVVGAGSDETPQETREHDDCFGCVNADADTEVLAVVDAPWPLALEAVASVALDRDPEYGTHVVDGPVKVQQPDGTWADVLPAEPEHVHDPFVAWHENGIPYATCACGTTWERQTCEVCPAIVAALHVATHGPMHKHCAEKKRAADAETARTENTIERTNP